MTTTGISTLLRTAGQPNPTPPGYDNDQLSEEALTETVSRARALGIPTDLLDTARPTVRAAVTDAIDDAWLSDYRLQYTQRELSDARARQGAKWPLIPGIAGGALLGMVAGATSFELMDRLRPGSDKLSYAVTLAVGAAAMIGTVFGVRAIYDADTGGKVRELVQQEADRRVARDAAVAEAIRIATP
jgi:hypothetical protein